MSQLAGAVIQHYPDCIISRDVRLLVPLLATRRKGRAVPWLHEYRGKFIEHYVFRKVSCLLATNSAIATDVQRHARNVPAFITGNPVFEERVIYGRRTTKEVARRMLGLNHARPFIVYTGKLYPGMRELEYLLDAAKNLPDCEFLMTGGQPPAVRSIQAEIAIRGIQNVALIGFLQGAEETRLYQQAADILVSYYSIHDHPFARHNLPNKLAEYMTTGNPVIVADFPAVRDLATGENAVLVAPDDADALIEALRNLLRDPRRGSRLGARAQTVVQEHSFERVAEHLTRFLASSTTN